MQQNKTSAFSKFIKFVIKITWNLYQTEIDKQGGSMSVPSQTKKSMVLIVPPPLKESYAQK